MLAKKLQLPPDSVLGLCPWTPLGSSVPQTRCYVLPQSCRQIDACATNNTLFHCDTLQSTVMNVQSTGIIKTTSAVTLGCRWSASRPVYDAER